MRWQIVCPTVKYLEAVSHRAWRTRGLHWLDLPCRRPLLERPNCGILIFALRSGVIRTAAPISRGRLTPTYFVNDRLSLNTSPVLGATGSILLFFRHHYWSFTRHNQFDTVEDSYSSAKYFPGFIIILCSPRLLSVRTYPSRRLSYR